MGVGRAPLFGVITFDRVRPFRIGVPNLSTAVISGRSGRNGGYDPTG